MPLEKRQIEWVRGDDYEVPFHFTNSDGSNRDISGWTVYFTMKKSIEDADSKAPISVDKDTHEDPTAGRTTITIPNTDTDGMNGVYVFDAQYKKPDETVTTFVQGTVEVQPDVTRRI